MCTDGQLATDGATLLADVGADKTDLVVADGPRIWTRTIQIGGNNFTEALVRAFKLSFGKAESLKRTAATSKYARQVFQAMRPVFADLVQEIQRSIGYYTSLHRESRFKRVLGLGNGFRLPGLQKFLEQNLNIPVVKIDSFNTTVMSPELSEPTFTEDILSFGVAYGLALQGLNEAKVGTNLLPDDVVRKRLWDSKRPWFAASAAALLIAMSCWVYRGFADRLPYPDDVSGTVSGQTKVILDDLKALRKRGGDIPDGGVELAQMKKTLESYGHRQYWPAVMSMFSQAVEAVAPDNAKYRKCAEDRDTVTLLTELLARGMVQGKAMTPAERKQTQSKLAEAQGRIKDFNSVDRATRKMIFMDNFISEYLDNAVDQFPSDGISTPSPTGQTRGFVITTQFRTSVADITYIQKLIKSCRALAKQRHPNLWFYGGYMTDKSKNVAVAEAPAGAPAGAEAGVIIDPVTKADCSDDIRVLVRWVILVENDGVKYPAVAEVAKSK